MSIRCGFFNAIENDRRYDAEDMGKLFDGVISDGIFGTMDNTKFEMQIIENSMTVKVLSGKAWFKGKYFEIERNTEEIVTISASDQNPRYDAIYLKIDNTQSDGGRFGSLAVQPGQPNATPTKPEVTSSDLVTKVVIGYVLVPALAVSLNEATIESNIGNNTGINRCPYAEPTLDKRRAMYIYDSQSSIDPTINEYKTLDFDINLNTYLSNKTVDKKGTTVLTPSDFGLDSFDDTKIASCEIKDAFYSNGANPPTIYSIYAVAGLVVLPLAAKFTDNNTKIEVTTKYFRLNVDNGAYVKNIANGLVNARITLIKTPSSGGNQNE